ncbi:MAG: Asp-tRNA(Asn)/Glu-tRNA(Gln) amidotransferase subunit GatC [Elusimicrobiaceae bacterium]|nr:Asp-tRNA(Asn)/Glu-tRNA(Gln) amidotransferase subunit GatC [Elusimicrobiaceae bacterium]
MKVTQAEVEKIARLAMLELTPQELALYGAQFERILELVGHLDAVDTSGVPETANVHGFENVLRQDELRPFANGAAILANAPEREYSLFKVKKVIE